MIYNGKEVEFPAIMQVSFFKLIEQLEKQANSKDKEAANYAKELLAIVKKYPELRDGISDISRLKKYQKAIEKLSKPLFPEVLSTNEIKILSPPFYFEPLYSSERFKNIIKASGQPFSFTMRDVDEDTFYLYCCYFILGSYYGYPVSISNPQLFEIDNQTQGLTRTYKLLINADMSEFEPTERAVDITRADYEELIENFGDMKLWKKKFPPNSWIMRGLNILNLVDVTADQAINSITSNLLVYDPDSFENIKKSLRKMLNDPSLHIGVVNCERGQLQTMEKSTMNSLILEQGEYLNCNEDLCPFSYRTLFDEKEPLVITNADKFHKLGQSGLSQKLLNSKFKSYIIAPVIHEDELLGFLELGSKEEYKLHRGVLMTLKQVMPILGMAKKRFQTEAQNLVEAIIQQECTTIHPSVKWRFEEEAQKFMKEQLEGQQPVFKDIVFDQLYPLYGQLDIKGSSERRNKAVSADLIKQLKSVSKVLKEASRKKSMPVYEELQFRLDKCIKELKGDLAAGSEHKILTFLRQDVYPVLDYLHKTNAVLRPLITEYYALLDDDLQTVYEERKKYDLSVNRVNQHLASFIDKKQIEAQQMFPHYFERYKTDGIEFNMYIGQSITNDHLFDKVFLKNLRLWQLAVMCEMENEFNVLRKSLNFSIEIASLILVYNTPIAVHFRMDEKKFDVEGAYNARYEIIKKRVDKAYIKGTKERITRPGSIVIVYSQEQDAQEYHTYIEYLTDRGYLKEGVEDLELQDLQGVHGLSALRVDINYSGNLTVDELIKEMEGNVS
ncbi:GAF domain-containing protein [Ekhidna sp.]|uniref:GAF domain-containing protein n=1 Tax=Ekhidna sp. TaxID=2608089 RepID=UPI003C7E5745